MNSARQKTLSVAVLDLYEGVENEGMRCIRDILSRFGKQEGINLDWKEFDVRLKQEIPDLSYDIYLSSGGPGSPLESEGSEWERRYFDWLHRVEEHNMAHPDKKSVLFICHSFQLACRYFKVAEVTKRRSTAFGVFPIHPLAGTQDEPLLEKLNDPFYAVDSRDFQVVNPHLDRLHEMGAKILCIEKERPHVPLERAIMAIRFNEHMAGTQFHPEADASGMTRYLLREDKKKTVIENYGLEKWQSMIDHLNDPDKILWTNSQVIPNFLHHAIRQKLVFQENAN
jgi:GMP synthase-like glutamine amidotransferase